MEVGERILWLFQRYWEPLRELLQLSLQRNRDDLY